MIRMIITIIKGGRWQQEVAELPGKADICRLHNDDNVCNIQGTVSDTKNHSLIQQNQVKLFDAFEAMASSADSPCLHIEFFDWSASSDVMMMMLQWWRRQQETAEVPGQTDILQVLPAGHRVQVHQASNGKCVQHPTAAAGQRQELGGKAFRQHPPSTVRQTMVSICPGCPCVHYCILSSSA